ncbi:hypothetical protein SteCoe_31309 [Stentor coeruleus]|uniref:PPM-type phosphatase domain-containing protein n=1 Tax=Stentor coeruleus TaxID=5963 RepID=A0A1R2B1K8_9CILI|nr:hypothetical protein SteCoe_31309 [Stentor coeruleus]
MGACVHKKSKIDTENLDALILKRKFSSIVMTNEQASKLKIDNPDSQINDSIKPSKGKSEQGSLMLFKEKIILEGLLSTSKQHGFEEKRMSINRDEINPQILSDLGISVTCKKGLKPDCPNQDDYFVAIDNQAILFGVFDGHGPFGHDISNYVHKVLPSIISNYPQWEFDPEQAFRKSFKDCHNLLISESESLNKTFDCSISGTTATLAYMSKSKLCIAHVGDSRAVLAQSIGNEIKAKILTKDHRPNLPEENERIGKFGGEVRQLSEDSPYRVFFPGENYPGLNMSRSFGDKLSRGLGVICEPDVLSLNLTEDDLFILICSDGVWEFITSQEAVNLVNKCDGDAKKASEKLSALAWMRWKQHFNSLVDDITVILVYLNR